MNQLLQKAKKETTTTEEEEKEEEKEEEESNSTSKQSILTLAWQQWTIKAVVSRPTINCGAYIE